MKPLKGSQIFQILQKYLRKNLITLSIHKPFLGSCDVPQKNVNPIGYAVLTFIAKKETEKQTRKVFNMLEELFTML